MVDDFFSRAFGYTPLSTLIPNGGGLGLQPEADIFETNDKVIVVCPMPGFEANQINVQATDQTITIEAERKPLVESDTARPYRLGPLSSMSRCQASFNLPDEINPGQITASFKNGVLHIEAPKSERARHKSVKVSVRG
jgi:HSP20 family protein